MTTDLQERVIANARRRGVIVVRHAKWGGDVELYKQRLTTYPVTAKKADTLWQHITVTFDSGKLIGHFKKDMRTLERIGKERFGSGVSYNWCIDPITGMVGEGQLLEAKGTHTVNDKGIRGFSYNQNLVARAMAWIGMPGMVPTTKAKHAAAQLFAAMVEEGALTPDPDYEPHSLVAYKDCPTEPGRAAMREIKAEALAAVGKPVRLRRDVVALRKAIAVFLSRPRRRALKRPLLAADAALAKFEGR